MNVYVLMGDIAVDDYHAEQRVVGVFASYAGALARAKADWIADGFEVDRAEVDGFFDEDIREMDLED
jgi:hypothetical protein